MSLAAPYPGTFLYKQAMENGWLDADHAELVDDSGVQIAPLHYPHLSHTEIFDNVETFYRRFYFRAPKIASIVGEMVRSPQMMKRRLREGVEFFQFLRERQARGLTGAATAPQPAASERPRPRNPPPAQSARVRRPSTGGPPGPRAASRRSSRGSVRSVGRPVVPSPRGSRAVHSASPPLATSRQDSWDRRRLRAVPS